MATDFQQIRANNAVTSHASGNKSTAAAVAWVDMRDYKSLLAVLTPIVLATDGGITEVKIQASTASNGANPVDVKSLTINTGDEAATVGDQLVIEVEETEIRQAGAGLRYVSVVHKNASATDRACVTYVRSAKHGKLNLTANLIQ